MAMLIGCKKEGQQDMQPEDKNDEGFIRYEATFLDNLWQINPEWAAKLGNHTNDSVLLVPSEQRKKMLNLAKLNLDSLSRYPENELSDASRMDYYLIQNYLRSSQWTNQQLKAWEWDPTTYNITSAFAIMLNEPSEILIKRLKTFNQKLEDVPAYFKDAQKQVKNPVPELTDLAIDQLTAGLDVIEKSFIDSVHNSSIPDVEEKVMATRAKLGADAIRGFVAFLKTTKGGKGRSFRLGKELYEDKFKNEIQSSFTAQQVYNAAMERKKVVHRSMIKLAKELWPKHMAGKSMPSDSLQLVADVIEALSEKHAAPEEFQSAITAQLPKLSAFVQSKDFLTPDPSKSLTVRKQPAYLPAIPGAYVAQLGPYAKHGNVYYYVSSPAKLDKDQAESFMREYNDYTLQLLNMHEAIPGRFTQNVFANNSSGLIKAVFANSAMIEGWASYAEEVMLDAGYGENAPELRLMWYKWHLRSVTNALLDYGVHTTGMTKDAAMKLLTKEAFQQQTEAENKWTQVTLNSVYLTSQFTGYKEIKELRDAYKKKMADKYRLKDFHDKLLSYGNAPVKYIKEAMLAKEKQEATK
ncbi:MAG: DUF885 domain-containing protein [Sphingobacteriaceae bacterium]|nr:MAG: DUF885 domain-containing protein [Sphingobacteriaceae bacterium]